MEKRKKAAIVACSNGLVQEKKKQLDELYDVLNEMEIEAVFSNHIFEKETPYSGTGKQRADNLMKFFIDPEVQWIFDVSGGDMANEVLPFLDFEVIKSSQAVFWGYSDLTTIVNAIYAQTGKSSVLYQIRNLVGPDKIRQIRDFKRSVLKQTELERDAENLFTIETKMLRGDSMEGILIGGNIRCLLKLAGTPYWPDMKGKILLLEAWHGKLPQMTTFLSQLKQMGVFEQVSGVLLGTFTQMEEEQIVPTIEELLLQYAGDDVPIAKTLQVGHGKDARAVWIGKPLNIKNNKK